MTEQAADQIKAKTELQREAGATRKACKAAQTIVGIDYGAKLSGYTRLVHSTKEGQLVLLAAAKNSDADKFLLAALLKIRPEIIAIDAPLSLPIALRKQTAGDCFYRQGDRQLKAMSPMFLGGLTARAISLKFKIQAALPEVRMVEIYPRAFVEAELKLLDYRDNDLDQNLKQLQFYTQELGLNLPADLSDMHSFDAVAAYLSGLRFSSGQAVSHGDQEEGVIWV